MRKILATTASNLLLMKLIDQSPRCSVFLIGFCLSLIVYCLSPVMTPTDSRYSSHIAFSILSEGNTNLDEFDIEENDYRVNTVGEHRYSYFPIWSAFLLIPSVAAAKILTEPVLGALPQLENLIRSIAGSTIPLSDPIRAYELYPIHELLTSAFLAALSVGILGLLGLRHLPVRYALLVVVVFAFATPMWSTVSRAMWMHSPSVLMILLTLLYLDRAGEKAETVAYAGATVALAYMFRPTNAVAVVAVTTYVFFRYRPQFIRYLLFAAPFAVLYLGWNYMLYQSWISSYGAASRLLLHDQFIPALIGNWVSPSRGLLIYCPLFVFSFIGFWQHRSKGLVKMIVLLVFGHWLVISLYPHWWAGYSYGPRFFSDMTPMFCYGLILFLKSNPLQKPLVKASFIVLLVFGLFVHGNGGINMDAFHWNSVPASVDEQTGRLWDWCDPQFARIVSRR